MLYAGQEFGERGMDKEGFSGIDGRTTIFDYWMVDSLRRGYFDRRKRTKEEKELSNFYQTVLLMANKEKAFYDGETFDLMYVNQHIAEHQFAFLRKADREMFLVVANFSDDDKTVDVMIPKHAFEYMNIPETEATATDLLTKEQLKTILRKDNTIRVELKAWNGRAYKFKF